MTIRTRQFLDADEDIVGAGPYGLRLELEELQLIAMYLSITRLGPRPYQDVAMSLLQKVEEVTGSTDFVPDAFEAISPAVTIELPSSGVSETYDAAFCTIEV